MVESVAVILDIKLIIITLGLFFVAAVLEIGGGYLVWQWIRERKGIVIGLIGGIILFVYGIILLSNHHILEEHMQRMEEYLLFRQLYGE